jgi:predicted CXXCH cytochrome family protein
LSVGVHFVTASVTDSDTNTDSDSITVWVKSTSSPHGDYIVTTDQCAACHRAHTGQSPRLISSSLTGDTFCNSCHDGVTARAMSTHSNVDFGSGVEANFTVECAQCHEPHGSTNLANVRSNVKVTSSVTTGPVVFTSFTGADSFDEDSGDADDTDDICVTCHINPSNPGFGMTSHAGGDHGGGSDYRGTNCLDCHPHDPDSDAGTRDGFMPVGGGCTGCHATAQDDGDGTPPTGRRQIVGAGGDFSLASAHHASGTPIDDDCVVCHEQTQHKDDVVRLYNVDNTSTVYALDGTGDLAEIEAFCLACHDADGAGGATQPFSDNQTPPLIDSTAWAAASHLTAAGQSCFDCHDNGHGSNKRKLLAPWNATSDGDPDDPLQEEERFCYACHDSDGPAGTDILSVFSPGTRWVVSGNPAGSGYLANPDTYILNDRHDIALTDQGTSGAQIECADCHDPHTVNNSLKLTADPDPGDGRTPGTGYVTNANFYTDWCLDCHDGSYPASITSPSTTLIDILTTYPGDSHGEAGGSATLRSGYGYGGDMTVQCLDCHIPHVSSTNQNLFHVVDVVMSADGSTAIPHDDIGGAGYYNLTDNSVKVPAVNGYNWCNTCHTGSMGDKKDNCFDCHYHSTRW